MKALIVSIAALTVAASPLFAQGYGRLQDGFFLANTAVSIAAFVDEKIDPRVDGRGSHREGFPRAPQTRTIDYSTIPSDQTIALRSMLSRRTLGLDGKPECGRHASKHPARKGSLVLPRRVVD